MNKDMILGLVRHVLTFGGGYIVAANIADAALVNEAIGAIMSLVGIGWSIYAKRLAIA